MKADSWLLTRWAQVGDRLCGIRSRKGQTEGQMILTSPVVYMDTEMAKTRSGVVYRLSSDTSVAPQDVRFWVE